MRKYDIMCTSSVKMYAKEIKEATMQKDFIYENYLKMPDDLELIEDLAGRKYEFDSKGRLRIESKDEFKKRFGRSPDKGDAFLMTWYNNEDLTLIKK